MLTYILIALAAIVLVLIGIAAFQPSRFEVARSLRIAAPAATIFPFMNSLRRGAEWSPYHRKDPNMRSDFSGPESGVGAQLDFDGNKDAGSGRLTITDSVPDSRVVIRLQMHKPMRADNVVTYALSPVGDATEVTWSLSGDAPLIARVVCLFFNMDRMVGRDFEAGLANLKSLAEPHGANT